MTTSPTRSTVRLAEKEATEELKPAMIRRAIDAITEMTGCRRKQAREQVRAFTAGGRTVTELDAWLQLTFRIDPTGVTAVRNVHRERPGGDVA